MEWLGLLKWFGLAVGGLGTIASAVGEFVPDHRKKQFKAIGLAVAVIGFVVGIASEWQTQRNEAVAQREDAQRAQEQRETAQNTLNGLKQLLQDQEATLDQVQRVMYRVDPAQVSASFQIELDLSGKAWDSYRAVVEKDPWTAKPARLAKGSPKPIPNIERYLGPGYRNGFALRPDTECFPVKEHQPHLALAFTHDIQMKLKIRDAGGDDDEPHEAALRFSVRDVDSAYYAYLGTTPVIRVFTKPAQLGENQGGSMPLLSVEDLLGGEVVFETVPPTTKFTVLKAITLRFGALRIQIPPKCLQLNQEGGVDRWTCVLPDTMSELVTGRWRPPVKR